MNEIWNRSQIWAKKKMEYARLGPYKNKYMTLLKHVFFELDDATRREFWHVVGESDDRLTDPRAGKPAFYLLESAYESELT